jgi:stearoyl-CoA desaturase (delta-9 desaturase)
MQIKYSILNFFLIAHICAIYGLYLLFKKSNPLLYLDLLLQQQIISILGITIGAHRLWSHSSFKATFPFRILLMLCNSICNQGSIYWWCRDHILHHKYSDTDADPYNSKRGLFFSHMGWVFIKKHDDVISKGKSIDSSYLLNDSVVKFQLKYDPYLRYFCCYILPTIYGYFVYDSLLIGLFIFGFLKWVISLHLTWTVNSLAHYSGNKPYQNNIPPSDNWLVSVLSAGEGWHNFHHTYPYDYTCSGSPVLLQYNLSTFIINICKYFGCIYDTKRVSDKTLYMPLVKKILPYVNTIPNNASYVLIINDFRALRTWFFENKDQLEGFTIVYKHNLIDVQGNFNDFMDDLIKCAKNNIPIINKITIAVQLYLIPKLHLNNSIKPFTSNLPKHSIDRDKEAVAYHYDVSNDFFELFLSKNMLYTSGIFKDINTNSLDMACVAKLHRATSLLNIKSDDSVLDIGCGWGGFIEYCSHITNNCKGITISKQQIDFFKKTHTNLLDKILYMHYKELPDSEKYDKIVAFQCTEHMPYDELNKFFGKIKKILKPGCRILIEFMTTVKVAKCHPFFDKYIFPDGAQFPLSDAIAIAEKNRLKLISIESLDNDYYLTIKNWVERLESNAEKGINIVGNERYRVFLLYLKWAEWVYKSGRSKCYTCIWENTM